jgi:hypothetical protein
MFTRAKTIDGGLAAPEKPAAGQAADPVPAPEPPPAKPRRKWAFWK